MEENEIPAFWPAAQVRRKFGAQRRIAEGRLCRPRAFQSPKGGAALKGGGTQNKKDIHSDVLFVLVETTELESVTFRV